jgi:amidase
MIALDTSSRRDAPFPVMDTIGAWMPHGRFVIDGAASGSLAGLRFAVKDLFDVAGYPTGAGNPTWLATHPLPEESSPLVTALLSAGATLVGKTLTDELAYSINGDNAHYGTPVNTQAPGRIPGGSSSGSAAAVAARLCDFALGTDTGGSTRVPASYCGLWGIRTSHGRLSRTHMVALNPGFDTPTWLAHDAATFQQVADVLLPPAPAAAHPLPGRPFRRAMLFDDVFAEADGMFLEHGERLLDALDGDLATSHARVAGDDPGGLEDWRKTYITISGHEAWQEHGQWIETHQPLFGAAVAGRWRMAQAVSREAADAARARQAEIRAAVQNLLGADGVALVPSAVSVAPLLTTGESAFDLLRSRILRITCVASLAGLPQVSMPFRSAAGLPIGLSLIGPAGSDRALVELAVALWRRVADGPV